MKRLLLLSTAAIFSASMAFAAIDVNALVARFQAEGYTHIEVKTGPTQIKIEATMGGVKVEEIWDIESDTLLKREVEAADLDDAGDVGVEFSTEDEDFLDEDDLNDDDEDELEDGEDDDNSGSDDDNEEDDSDEDDDSDDDEDDDHSGSDDEDDSDDDHGGDDD